jgi:hypothetical protein
MSIVVLFALWVVFANLTEVETVTAVVAVKDVFRNKISCPYAVGLNIWRLYEPESR